MTKKQMQNTLDWVVATFIITLFIGMWLFVLEGRKVESLEQRTAELEVENYTYFMVIQATCRDKLSQ